MCFIRIYFKITIIKIHINTTNLELRIIIRQKSVTAMKVLIFIVINILAVSAYTIRQLNGITGTVRQIEFDSKQNTYIVAYNSSDDNLYKFDSNNNKILTQTIHFIWKILVNKQDDVFIFSSDSTEEFNLNQISVRRLKAGSNTLELLFKYYSKVSYWDPSYFIDKDDNIFFNTYSGVSILKTNQNIPIAVSGLREFSFNLHAEDGYGNMYLANNKTADDSLVIVRNNSKLELIPSGTIIATGIRFTNGLISWNNGIVFSGYSTSNVSTVTYLEISLKGLVAQQYVNHTVLNGTSSRLFWIGRNFIDSSISHLHYYNQRTGEVVKIDECLNSTAIYKGGQHAVDKSGNFFLASYKTEGDAESQILLLKSTGNTFTKINISLGRYVVSLAVDKDDNLWVLTGDLYIILKNVEYAIKISESQITTSASSQLKIKESTSEVFIAADNGLFICTNE